MTVLINTVVEKNQSPIASLAHILISTHLQKPSLSKPNKDRLIQQFNHVFQLKNRSWINLKRITESFAHPYDQGNRIVIPYKPSTCSK